MANVSVIIPTYRRPGDVEAAVKSALIQSEVLEVLVCDDGSGDATEARIRSIDDARVSWIPGPHAGRPAVPRNRGLAAAKGEWIAFLDDDDSWMPGKLAGQFERLALSGARFSCTNAERIDGTGASRGPYFSNASSVLGFEDLLRVNPVICSSVLVHRAILDKAGTFPEAEGLKALEDYALWLRCAVFTPVDRLDQPLVVYRDVAANSIRAGGPSSAEQRARVLLDLHGSPSYRMLGPAKRRAVEGELRIAQGRATLVDRLIHRFL
ncbi:MAG TPA: glycosyltransferase [Flavobacteriales bacterium]